MEEPPPVFEQQPAPPDAPAMSLAGRLVNVYADPGEVFEEVKAAKPSMANWLVPALIFIVVSWLAAWAIFSQPAIRHQLADMAEKPIQKMVDKGRLSESQAEQARETSAKYAPLFQKVGAVVSPVVAGFFTPFWGGFILWLVGAQILKRDVRFMKAVEVAGLANMVAVLDVIVRSLLIVATGNLFATPSLMLLVKEFNAENPVHLLLAAANIMTFWLLAVRAVGLARLSGVSFAKAAAWLVAIWALLTGLHLGLAAGSQAIFNR